MEVQWLGHATALVELGGMRVLTDPVLGRRIGPLVRVADPVDPAAVARIDAVLLSHLHADHAQPASIRRLGSPAVIAPRGSSRWLRRHGIVNVRELRRGQELEVQGVRITAVAATHDGRRRPLGPSADALGYLIRDHRRGAYFAGDTDLFAGMADLDGEVDLALLPVSGWGRTLGPGHLDPARAARAAALIAPRVAIPIHWGTFALPRPLRGKPAGAAPVLEFMHRVAREAPSVEVRVLQPGERTRLAPLDQIPATASSVPPSIASRRAR
jgi:L-ascorbate metabolism protein UlaG (beta-lactamase superfamily)